MDYLRAVVRHTVALLVGALGLVLTAVGIVAPAYVHITGLVLLAVGVLAAQYLAWSDMRAQRDKEREEAAELRAQLDARAKRKAIREALGEFFSEGEEIRDWIERAGKPVPKSVNSGGASVHYTLPQDTLKPSLRGSIERADEWAETVAEYLAQHAGGSYVGKFDSPIGTTERPMPELSGKKHAPTWKKLDRRLQVLADIVKEVGDGLIGT